MIMSSSIYSLHNNFIGDKGVMALAVAMKTAIALQWLGLVDLLYMY